MPQARSGRSAGSTRSKAGAASSTGAKSGASTRAKSTSARAKAGTAKSSSAKSSAAKSSAAKSTDAKSSAAKAGSADARVEAVVERVRKLNEQIIEAGKETGEATLTSYEKALKSIAGAIERGPGSSEIDWISNLATAQAKFIRDLTEAWTKAARSMLK